ncbi:hypothetical protein ACNPQM_21420 [Streptomyces sp. NPDC056231]|uniref:hypothetical protein n=1 Tax=Streptomyces sp. NPDC056231 TaxID=3345755 RepID=UPI003AAE31FA
MQNGESRWAVDLFGSEQVVLVRERLGQALVDMQANARAAQNEGEVDTNHPYGWTRWPGSYTQVARQFEDVEGAVVFKPNGFPFKLVHVGRGLLYPFRFSTEDTPIRSAKLPSVGPFIRELFTLAPRPSQTSIFDENPEFGPGSVEVRPRLASLPEGTQLVLVPYACNPHGLLMPYWGVASLVDEQGTLEWVTTPEPLPLAATPTRRRLSVVPPQVSMVQHASFDSGEQPVPLLFARPDAEQGRDVPPMTEPEPIEPLAHEDNEN